MLGRLPTIIIPLALLLAGCSGSAKSPDAVKHFISTYEPEVIAWERRADAREVSREDLAQLSAAVSKVEAEFARLEAAGSWSEEDRSKAEALKKRFVEIAPRVVANSSWYP